MKLLLAPVKNAPFGAREQARHFSQTVFSICLRLGGSKNHLEQGELQGRASKCAECLPECIEQPSWACWQLSWLGQAWEQLWVGDDLRKHPTPEAEICHPDFTLVAWEISSADF